MANTKIFSIALNGLIGELVEIEIDISDGLPGFTMLGLPDATLHESKERVRASIINSGFIWPHKKIIVSLTPAWLPKSGSHFDLPIALGILRASGVIANEFPEQSIYLGELALNGEINSIRGILPALLCASRKEIHAAFIPCENIIHAEVISSISSNGFHSLKEIVEFHNSSAIPAHTAACHRTEIGVVGKETNLNHKDISEVSGHLEAKRALEIAAIGGHHLLLMGPPGAGKTMLAERLPTLFPLLSEEQSIEVASIASVAGTDHGSFLVDRIPPFISPHHSITIPALVGGGRDAKPGAISLAHHGVLFIDEAPESDRKVLDALRAPLENKTITISRHSQSTIYPADFLLVFAANPCPCGRYTGRGYGCSCSASTIRRYLQKLSGPLLDRIDIRIHCAKPSRTEISDVSQNESSSQIRERVVKARQIAAARFKPFGFALNSQIPAKLLKSHFQPERSALILLEQEVEKERVSARGFHKIQRLSWSIADLYQHERPQRSDVMEAIALREGLEQYA